MKKIIYLSFLLLTAAASCKKNNISEPPPIVVKQPVYGTVSSYEGKVPAIYINTLGNTILNEPKVKSQIQVRVGDTIVLEHDIGIEYRGSSSYYLFDQKSYGWEFWDASNNGMDSVIMDLPKEEDFILYAPANDKSLLRNVLIYDLSNQIGQYATRTRYVELYKNNLFDGLYVLMEKIKRNKNRVNITKMANTDISGTAVTGGYILKIDKSTGDGPQGSSDAYYDATISFRSHYDPNGQPLTFAAYGSKKASETYFLYEYPKPEDIIPEQKAYISRYVYDFEKVLLSENYKDPASGYAAFIEVPTFVDFFLLNELSQNPDAYRLSTFMYKNRSGKLRMGPLWDFNLAFGNDSRSPIANATNWAFNFNDYYPYDTWVIHFWWKRLLSDPNFTQAIKSRWNALRAGAFNDANIENTINKYVALLEANKSITHHFTRWDFLGKKLPFNGFVGATYAEELNYLKSWIKARTFWMDQNIAKL